MISLATYLWKKRDHMLARRNGCRLEGCDVIGKYAFFFKTYETVEKQMILIFAFWLFS